MLFNDPRSTLNKNFWFLENLTTKKILKTASFQKLKELLPICEFPSSKQWRISLLNYLFKARHAKKYDKLNVNKKVLQMYIDSLCIS